MAKIQCNVISYTLKRTVDIDIILPTVSIPESLMSDDVHHHYDSKFPVLYLLHGYGNNHAQWCGYTNIELYAEERQIAVVMISGENKMYIDKNNDLFSTFIQNELREFVTNTFPISSRREDSYIAGLSMGGFGALFNGMSRPDLYRAIGAFSPAVEMEGVSESVYSVLNDYTAQNQDIFITCGDQDFVYQTDVKFVKALKEKNVQHTWISVKDYKHEWRFWDLSVERFLDWLPRSDAYANNKRNV